MKQKLLLKQKRKLSEKTGQKLSSSQKVALHAVQKQMQLLKLREWLVVMGFVFGGALLRIPMQAVPSAEPITFFAILSGWLFGKKKGFITGAAAGYMSNFFMFGGQGPWSIFQVLSWGIAGFLGGFIKDIQPKGNYIWFWIKSILPVILIAIVSTLIFDTVMNLSWAMFMPYGIFALFLSGLPFLVVHLISNVTFSLFLPFARKIVYEKGKFDEMDICHNIISRIGNRVSPDRGKIAGKTAEQ